MDEWMNEWMNKWMNEWMNEWIKTCFTHIIPCIVGEEFKESVEFCKASNLSAFLLENIEDGSLKCVAIGTGRG